MSRAKDYLIIVVEEIRDQNKAVLEAVGQMQEKIKTLATQESLDALTVKVETIQLTVTYTNKDLKALEARVTVLEQPG